MEGISIYHLDFESFYQLLPIYQKSLNIDEQKRANSFLIKEDRDAFVICRGALRAILSKQLYCLPEAVKFDYTSRGKPILSHLYDHNNIEFNVSHTHGCGLIAITSKRKVGIDIECYKNIPDLDSLISVILTEEEKESISSLSKYEMQAAFFYYWTQKEALLKGLGSGLYEKMRDYAIGDWKALKKYFTIGNNSHQWHIETIHLSKKDKYIGAIAYEGKETPIFYYDPCSTPILNLKINK